MLTIDTREIAPLYIYALAQSSYRSKDQGSTCSLVLFAKDNLDYDFNSSFLLDNLPKRVFFNLEPTL